MMIVEIGGFAMAINSPLEYCTISIRKEIKIDTDIILKYNIQYPQFMSTFFYKTVGKINAYYFSVASKFETYIMNILLPMATKDYYHSKENDFPIHAYEAVMVFTITYNQDCILSLYTDKYEYTGGAHGSTVRTSETWDVTLGTQIPLYTLFPYGEQFRRKIIIIIIKQIENQMAYQQNYFPDYVQRIHKSLYLQNYYLSPDSITIYFQQYDIAPYSTGIPEFSIPLSELNIQLPNCKKTPR